MHRTFRRRHSAQLLVPNRIRLEVKWPSSLDDELLMLMPVCHTLRTKPPLNGQILFYPGGHLTESSRESVDKRLWLLGWFYGIQNTPVQPFASFHPPSSPGLKIVVFPKTSRKIPFGEPYVRVGVCMRSHYLLLTLS
jgi:hypothetical protein